MGFFNWVKGKTSAVWESGKAWFTGPKTAKDAIDKSSKEMVKISKTSRNELELTAGRTREFMDDMTNSINSTLNCAMEAVNDVILPEIQETASTARGCMKGVTKVAQGFEKMTRKEIVPEMKKTARSARNTLKEVDSTVNESRVLLKIMSQGLQIIFVLLIFAIYLGIGYCMTRNEDDYKNYWGAYIEYELCRFTRVCCLSVIVCAVCNFLCLHVLHIPSDNLNRKRALICCWVPALAVLCIYLGMLVGYCMYYSLVFVLVFVYAIIENILFGLFIVPISQTIVFIMCKIYQVCAMVVGMVHHLLSMCLSFQTIYYVVLFGLLPFALSILVYKTFNTINIGTEYKETYIKTRTQKESEHMEKKQPKNVSERQVKTRPKIESIKYAAPKRTSSGQASDTSYRSVRIEHLTWEDAKRTTKRRSTRTKITPSLTDRGF